MARIVSIVGGSPTWRRGIGGILTEHDFAPVEALTLSGWVPGRGGVAIIIWAEDPDVHGEIAAQVQEYPAIPVISVVPEIELGRLADALRSGCTGVVDEADEPETIIDVISSALTNRTSVPRHLAEAMAQRIPRTPDADAWVTDEERTWLRALADGVTVAGLSDRIGFSERETFRMLGDLYLKIGVKNRTESIIWATRHGILDD